jgi:hypothetical protein
MVAHFKELQFATAAVATPLCRRKARGCVVGAGTAIPQRRDRRYKKTFGGL